MPIAGKDGWVSIGTDTVGYLDNWSLSFASDTAEVSRIGKRAKEFMNTTISSSGSAGGTLNTTDISQSALLDMFAEGGTLTDVALHLVLQSGDISDEEFTGQAVITGIEIGSSFADKVTFSFNFQFTGEVEHVEAS